MNSLPFLSANGIMVYGAEQNDTCFTVTYKGLPPFTWNISRMERDAFRGRFGNPKLIRFSALEGGGGAYDPNNIDAVKVARMIVDKDKRIARPFWKTQGKSIRNYPLIDIPIITVMLKASPDGSRLVAIPVDGNHRMSARHELGLPTFTRFEVPSEMEPEYRVTMTALRPPNEVG